MLLVQTSSRRVYNVSGCSPLFDEGVPKTDGGSESKRSGRVDGAICFFWMHRTPKNGSCRVLTHRLRLEKRVAQLMKKNLESSDIPQATRDHTPSVAEKEAVSVYLKGIQTEVFDEAELVQVRYRKEC